MSGNTPIAKAKAYKPKKNAVMDAQTLTKLSGIEQYESSVVSNSKKHRKRRCDPCAIPVFIIQLIFSIPSFIGCVLSVIVVILMSAVIILFSIQSKDAVGEVSLSVRDLSISSITSHLNSIFTPLVSSTHSYFQFRNNNNFTAMNDNMESVVRFLHAITMHEKVSVFCGDETYGNVVGLNNRDMLNPENEAELWRLVPNGNGASSWVIINEIYGEGSIGAEILPPGTLEVDNTLQPYTQAIIEEGFEIAKFTPLTRDTMTSDFFIAYVIGGDISPTSKQFCWNSLLFGNSVSEHLASTQQFPNSLMFLVERDGNVVASSDVQKVPNVKMPGQLRLSLDDAPDSVVANAFKSLKEEVDITKLNSIFRHSYGSYFMDVLPYTGPEGVEGIDWLIILMTPHDDILGKVTASQNLSLGISIGVLVFGLLLAYFTSFCITLPLFQIKNELQRVSRLQLNPKNSMMCQVSFLSEIRALSTATSKLKSGLQSFERYVPSSVVHMILLENRAAELGMKPFLLSALFSDIVNFTSLAEKEDPQSLVDQLEEYFTLFNRKLQSYGLALISYIGDAVFAFATHKDSPLHALKACLCACEMQSDLALLNNSWIENGKPALYTRIGVHTGEALVGNIGSYDRFSFTALGDTINLASRLEAINKVYHTMTCVSEATRDHVLATNQPDIQLYFIPMDLVAVKGKETRVTIYNLVSTLEEAMPKGLTPSEDVISIYENMIEAYKGRDFESAKIIAEEAGKEVSEDPRLAPLLSKIQLHLSGEAPADIDQMSTK